MAKMTAIQAAVLVMEKEGMTQAFGVPGAAINPLYAALRKRGSIAHILARHVEGASHMAEGYTRAIAGNIGVCIGTSGPAGTDMITGLYSARPTPFPSCASPARRRARGCTRKTSRRSTSSRSPSRSPSGRSPCASPARCRALSSRPST
jgi:tartronate-semialdehyde synthase